MTKVLHTIGGLHPNSGGPARTVTSLCEGLSKKSDVDIVLLTQMLVSEEIYAGTLCTSKLHIAESRSALLLKSGMPFRKKLSKVISEFEPDILHDHGVWLPSNHISASLAEKRDIPYVVHTRGMLEPWALSFRAAKKKVAWHLYQRRNLESAALFFATSDAEAINIRELGFTQPIAVIPNGVEIPLDDLQYRLDLDKDRERNVVFMGRIHPKKGLLELMKAWAQIDTRGWKLVLAGPDEGGHLAEVLSLAKELGLAEQVKYVGVVEGTAKASLLRSTDIFVLPSYSENFGVVVAEALAYGAPVISTVGTPWQGLLETKSGWWVKPESKDLGRALSEAISLGDDERYRMGVRGSKFARQFDWDEIAEKTKESYSFVLDGLPRPEHVRVV